MKPRLREAARASCLCLFIRRGLAASTAPLPLNLQELYPKWGHPETGQGVFTIELPVSRCFGSQASADLYPEDEVR